MNHIGEINDMLSNFPKALEFHKKVLEMQKKGNDEISIEIMESYGTIAATLANMNQ